MAKILKKILWILVFYCSIIHADEEPVDDIPEDLKVKAVLQEVEKLFEQRSISNPHIIDSILEKLSLVENQAIDPFLNFDVYIFESKTLFWKAKYLLHALNVLNGFTHLSHEAYACLNLGKAKADAAIKIDCTYAEGHYYSALNLSGLVRYILYSVSDHESYDLALKAVNEATEKMGEAIDCDTRSSLNGKTLDGWGPYREQALIQLHHPLFGISNANWKTTEATKKAYDHARNYAINVIAYAYALEGLGDRYETLMASLILDLMLSKDPKTYNPDRVEETLLEFEEAKKMRAVLGDGIFYETAKDGLKDYATATQLEQEVSIRIANQQTKLNDLHGELLRWLENQSRQEKIFSTFELFRSKIEDAAPVLITKIQAYLASQQDILQTILEDLNHQLRNSRDAKTRDALQFDIVVLSDLASVKKNLGGSQEELKKAIDKAVHGTSEERAKALSYFDPLTQICLKWVFQVTPPTTDNIFNEMKQEIKELELFSTEHLSTLKLQIQIAEQDLNAAHEDEFIARTLVEKIYDACQKARTIM